MALFSTGASGIINTASIMTNNRTEANTPRILRSNLYWKNKNMLPRKNAATDKLWDKFCMGTLLVDIV
jgi:hypothetical protein